MSCRQDGDRKKWSHLLAMCFMSGLYRGRGFDRLAGVTDTRGARGLVAVAERAGGRVRLLHYAPAFPPFYTTELTHLHRLARAVGGRGSGRLVWSTWRRLCSLPFSASAYPVKESMGHVLSSGACRHVRLGRQVYLRTVSRPCQAELDTSMRVELEPSNTCGT